jgi:orotidine-5'-phosphate decarboxylase
MSELFGDRLIDGIRAKAAPICVGIDPMFDQFPADVAEGVDPRDTDAVLDAIFDFTTRVLRVVAPLVPVVKFQSAYFERYLWDGVEAYYSLIREAKDLGLLTIGDIKRGDIGTTAAAYAEGHLDDLAVEDVEDVAAPDAITVNPMLGADTVEPFVRVAKETDTGRRLAALFAARLEQTLAAR